MKTMKELIKEAYLRLRNKKTAAKPKYRPSGEDMAAYAAGLLGENEKEKILDYIISHGEDEEALRHFFLLGSDISGGGAERVPQELVEKAKQFIPHPTKENVLEAVVEFAGNIARVIRTTGTVLTCAKETELQPAAAFRDIEAPVESKVVEISKIINNYIVDVKIEKDKKDLANLTILIRNKRSGKLSSGERVSLVYENRELMSSLTQLGKVEFSNIKLRDYKIDLVHKGQSYCIAVLSLKALGE